MWPDGKRRIIAHENLWYFATYSTAFKIPKEASIIAIINAIVECYENLCKEVEINPYE